MQTNVIPQGGQPGQTSLPSRAHAFALTRPWMATAREVLALLGVLALAFGLRTVFLGVRLEWVGGAYSLDAARKALLDSVAFLQFHPAADYRTVLVGAMRSVGSAMAPTRQLSLLTGMAAVLLTWRVGRRLFTAPIGILGAALLALSPFQVIASSESGMDMPLECLVLVSTLILWRALQWPSSLWFWGAYGAGVGLMARTSPYTLLLLPAPAVWVLVRLRFSEAIEHLCLVGAVAAALYLPGTTHALALPDPTVLLGQPVHFDSILPVVATQAFGGSLFNSGSHDTVGIHSTYLLLLLLPFLSSMAVGALALGRIDRWAQILIGLSWGVPVVLIALASPVLGNAAYSRPLLFIQPFAALILAAGVISLRHGLNVVPKSDRVTA